MIGLMPQRAKRVQQRRALIALLGALLALDCIADEALDFGADLVVTTDYMFRGVSQTMSGPALQICGEASHSSGFFSYAWASNVDFVADGDPDDGTRTEVDLAFGYSHALSDRVSATATLLHYFYPGSYKSVEYDYTELIAQVSVNDRHAVTIGYASNVFASGSPGLYVAVNSAIDLPAGLSLSAELGRYDLRAAYGESYTHGAIAVSGQVKEITWTVSYQLTSQSSRKLFSASTVQPRVVLSLGRSF